MAMRRSKLLTGVRRRPPTRGEPWDPDQRSRDLFCPWEIPLDHQLAVHVDPWRGFGAAYFPSCWDSIPAAATQALTELIAVSRPRDMLVVPAGIRRVRGIDVYCPTQVLAADARGVALWVDDLPFDRVTSILAYSDIRLVEHTSDTESANLTVIGATRRFTVHYRCRWRPNTRQQVADLLMRIRLGAAGTCLRLDADAAHTFTVRAAFARRVATELSQLIGEPSSLPQHALTPEESLVSVSDSNGSQP